MSNTDAGTREYPTLMFLLAVALIGSALTVASCGSGSSSDGALCDQCGESDGFCQGELGIPQLRVTADTTLPCDGDDVIAGTTVARPCDLTLTCLRKLDSAQRRCFPIAYDPQFRCDGARPDLGELFCGNNELDPGEDCDDGNTVDTDACRNDCTLPPTPTTTPDATATAATPTSTGPTTSPTPTPSATTSSSCGNGVIDDVDEECDGADLDEETCDDLCSAANDDLDVTGSLSCLGNCTFTFDGCVNATDCSF